MSPSAPTSTEARLRSDEIFIILLNKASDIYLIATSPSFMSFSYHLESSRLILFNLYSAGGKNFICKNITWWNYFITMEAILRGTLIWWAHSTDQMFSFIFVANKSPSGKFAVKLTFKSNDIDKWVQRWITYLHFVLECFLDLVSGAVFLVHFRSSNSFGEVC